MFPSLRSLRKRVNGKGAEAGGATATIEGNGGATFATINKDDTKEHAAEEVRARKSTCDPCYGRYFSWLVFESVDGILTYYEVIDGLHYSELVGVGLFRCAFMLPRTDMRLSL